MLNEKHPSLAQLSWKVVVTALWLLQAVNFIAYLLIVYLPGSFSSYSGLDNVAESPMTIAVFCAIPCLLIGLTLIAAPKMSRWPNVFFGAGYTLIKIAASVQILTGVIAGPDGAFPGGLLFNEIWASVAGALLVWCAWRVPNRDTTRFGGSESSASAA